MCIMHNYEHEVETAPTKRESPETTTTPDTTKKNDPWKVPVPSIQPAPKAFVITIYN